ncbi:MAG TPA: hypothetical protein VHQ20_02575 [Patescibacteria group bacterium]|nr:hypothetical protein [Patescibacteria group bacterium]
MEKARVSLENRVAFHKIFAFHSYDLTNAESQHEALIILTPLAKKAREWCQSVDNYPDNYEIKVSYQKTQAKYLEAVRLIKFFDPKFGSRIPHWSKFPDRLKELIAGNAENILPTTPVPIEELEEGYGHRPGLYIEETSSK